MALMDSGYGDNARVGGAVVTAALALGHGDRHLGSCGPRDTHWPWWWPAALVRWLWPEGLAHASPAVSGFSGGGASARRPLPRHLLRHAAGRRGLPAALQQLHHRRRLPAPQVSRWVLPGPPSPHRVLSALGWGPWARPCSVTLSIQILAPPGIAEWPQGSHSPSLGSWLPGVSEGGQRVDGGPP